MMDSNGKKLQYTAPQRNHASKNKPANIIGGKETK
jgi:hypothetical protein